MSKQKTNSTLGINIPPMGIILICIASVLIGHAIFIFALHSNKFPLLALSVLVPIFCIGAIATFSSIIPLTPKDSMILLFFSFTGFTYVGIWSIAMIAWHQMSIAMSIVLLFNFLCIKKCRHGDMRYYEQLSRPNRSTYKVFGTLILVSLLCLTVLIELGVRNMLGTSVLFAFLGPALLLLILYFNNINTGNRIGVALLGSSTICFLTSFLAGLIGNDPTAATVWAGVFTFTVGVLTATKIHWGKKIRIRPDSKQLSMNL